MQIASVLTVDSDRAYVFNADVHNSSQWDQIYGQGRDCSVVKIPRGCDNYMGVTWKVINLHNAWSASNGITAYKISIYSEDLLCKSYDTLNSDWADLFWYSVCI